MNHTSNPTSADSVESTEEEFNRTVEVFNTNRTQLSAEYRKQLTTYMKEYWTKLTHDEKCRFLKTLKERLNSIDVPKNHFTHLLIVCIYLLGLVQLICLLILITYHNGQVVLYILNLLFSKYATFYILYTFTDLRLDALFICSSSLLTFCYSHLFNLHFVFLQTNVIIQLHITSIFILSHHNIWLPYDYCLKLHFCIAAQ